MKEVKVSSTAFFFPKQKSVIHMIVETSVTVLMRVFYAQNLAMLAVVHTCTSFHFVLIQNFLTSRCQPNESMLERKRGK